MIQIPVDTLGNLLTVSVTSGSAQEREQVGELATKIQQCSIRFIADDTVLPANSPEPEVQREPREGATRKETSR
jgi:hypothetical protein